MTNDPIKHVVLLMLENHSFDQMLGCYKSIYPQLEGVDPANLNANSDTGGTVYTQAETDEVQTKYDPHHELEHVATQLSGGNQGFVRDFVQSYPSSNNLDRQQVMGYYGRGKLPALHALADDFTICDHWFSSLPGPTWPNRFFALSGTSNGQIDMPETTTDNIDPAWYIHQSQETIFQRLDEAKRTWKVYYYDFPNSWLLLKQLEPQNIIRYHHIDTFFQTDSRDEATFPDFVFIEPKYFGQDQNDDHPPHNVVKAEKLIGDVYNAIRSNPNLWNNTLLVVTFDEHGGFYDHVVPPAAPPPDNQIEKYAFNQFGLRVPTLLISPWVGRRVESTPFDHTSLLRYLIDKWSLGALGNRTAAANSIAGALNQSAPRADTVGFVRVPYSDLIPPHPEWEKQDPTSHQLALETFARYLSKRTGDTKIIHPTPIPNLWQSFQRVAGQKLVAIGNWLAADYEASQKARVERITALTKALASNELALKNPGS